MQSPVSTAAGAASVSAMAAFPRPYGRYLLDERIAMGGMAEIDVYKRQAQNDVKFGLGERWRRELLRALLHVAPHGDQKLRCV